jgi:16S rRNA (adenine1518-N6/adenine1519-N6)-dimethyltransferase
VSRRPRWGQNFLVDPAVSRAIVDWANVDGRVALEIGPGRGALTRFIVERARSTVLVEIDPTLVSALRAQWAGDERVRVVEGDALRVDLTSLAPEPMVVLGNLPYESGTAIVRRLVESPAVVSEAVVMLQKEVCERMTAVEGSKTYGALSVHMALRADVTPGRVIGPQSFRPSPKVDSQLLRIRPLHAPRWMHGSDAHFAALVQAAFGARRKMLRNTLGRWLIERVGEAGAAVVFEHAGVDPVSRPEQVSPERFARMAARSYALLESRAGAA